MELPSQESDANFEVVEMTVPERIESFVTTTKAKGCKECKRCLSIAYITALRPTPKYPHTVDGVLEMLNSYPCECPKRKVGNGAPSGAFAFTLTKSPKDPYTVGDMLIAVRKIMSQKSCKVARYAWYYEDKGRDDNGDPIHPHIHGMYETHSLGRIEAKHFMRAWPIWNEKKPLGAGFQGGYHRPVRSDEGYANYIKKDGGMSESFGMDEQTE